MVDRVDNNARNGTTKQKHEASTLDAPKTKAKRTKKKKQEDVTVDGADEQKTTTETRAKGEGDDRQMLEETLYDDPSENGGPIL